MEEYGVEYAPKKTVQRRNLPSVKDPKLWLLKCKVTRSLALSLARSLMFLHCDCMVDGPGARDRAHVDGEVPACPRGRQAVDDQERYLLRPLEGLHLYRSRQAGARQGCMSCSLLYPPTSQHVAPFFAHSTHAPPGHRGHPYDQSLLAEARRPQGDAVGARGAREAEPSRDRWLGTHQERHLPRRSGADSRYRRDGRHGRGQDGAAPRSRQHSQARRQGRPNGRRTEAQAPDAPAACCREAL